LELEESDQVYLKVSLIGGMQRIKVKGKLSICFIEPFMILKQVGRVAYQLEHTGDDHECSLVNPEETF
jgi:hypothetical protein